MPVAIITGGSLGLGKALASHLVPSGWDVVLDARGARELEITAAELAAAAPQRTVRAMNGDVTDGSHRAALVAAAEALGGVDLLVNNASILGPSPRPPLAAYPLDVLEDVFRVNVVAPIALVQAALPSLVARGGTVVNVTSDAAVEPYDGWGGYGSSKAALDQVSNILGAEQPAIRVYAFDPGDMRTRMHQEAFPGEDISDRPTPDTVVPALSQLLENRPPSGRYRAAELVGANR